MRRSRLESYEAILGVLVKKPLNIDRLAYKVDMDCAVLKQRLDFLMTNGLVEERILDKGAVYGITERGVTVFKTLDFQKYLKRISKTLLAIDDAMQDIPIILKRKQKSERELSDEKY